MAIIRSVEPGQRSVRAHRTQVDLTYQTVADAEGQRLLHIATYGSDERQELGATSQSMQFDRVNASRLRAAIDAAFPGIGSA